MESLTLEKIAKIALYDKGEYIHSPNKQYYVGLVYVNNEPHLVRISRKSLKHISEKGDLGVFLMFRIKGLLDYEVIVKNFKHNSRYILMRKYEKEIYGVVIEMIGQTYSIVTAMKLQERYIRKHFPQVSIH